MRKFRNGFLCLGIFLLVLAGPLGADDEGDVYKLIDKTISRMERGGFDNLWDVTHDLKRIAWRNREVAVDRIVAAAQNGSPLVKLGCAKTLLDLQGEQEAVSLLIELGANKVERNIRLSAISILGSTHYLPERLTSQIEEFLNKVLDEETDNEVRLETAKSLFQAPVNSFRIKARKALMEMYASDIREIKISAALALAEIGEIDRVQDLLQAIQDDPSYEGRMARLLLKFKDQERVYHEMVRKDSLGIHDGLNLNRYAYDLDLVAELIDIIREKHIHGDQFENHEGIEKLLTAAAKGMLTYLDPHSTYFSQKEHERWFMDLERKYAGIGAYVDTIDGIFTIVRPIYSGPAYEAGLRSGDQIWKVDGWETFNKPNEEIIRRLKGLPDAEVVVTIYRAGWKEERDFKINRAEISIPAVNAELLPGGIAYVEVAQFAAGTGSELLRKLEDLKALGADSLILDLRNNTGGYLNEAVNLCSIFLKPNQLVVYTEGRDGKRSTYKTRPIRSSWKAPMVVLVNRRSASASEIVAGALQYYRRAAIVGEKTYGKGSVQNPLPLESRFPEDFVDENGNRIYDEGEEFNDRNNNGRFDLGPMLKITTAMYYLPSGKSIHTWRDMNGVVINKGGITPEKQVKYEGIDSWKEEELSDLLEKKVFQSYVDEHYDGHKEVFLRLAEGDDFDTSIYPDFDVLFESLETRLSQNDIRKMIRVELRRRVPDDRKPARPFPGFGFFGDYQEDSQLQAAIVEILEKVDRDPHDILAYKYFADKEFKKPRSAKETAEVAKKDGAQERAEKNKGVGETLKEH